MDVLVFSARAVLPLLLPIALGYVLARFFGWSSDFFRKLNALSFRALLSVQLFVNTYKIDSFSAVNGRALAFLIISVFATIGLGMLLGHTFLRDPSLRGAFVHAFYRSNSAIIGVPLVAALSTLQSANSFLSVSLSILVPLLNISAVVVLSLYGNSGKQIKLGTLIKNVFTNPLLIGTLLGLACVFMRSLIPSVDGVPAFSLRYSLPSVYKTLESLASAAAPVMLLALGGQLDFQASKPLVPAIVFGVISRLVLLPLLFVGGAVLLRKPLRITNVEMPAIVAFFCAPTAVSGPVMVQELGGHTLYASQLVVWTSTFSMLTIFLFVAAMRALGLL